MTAPVQLEAGLSASGQLDAGDVARLAAEGVTRLVCMRPDDEEGTYLPAAEIGRLAGEQGMRFEHVPVRGLDVTDAARQSMADALASGDRTVAYCRSGRRVALAWALARVHAGMDPEDAIATARDAGVDLTQLAPQLEAARQTQAGEPQSGEAQTADREARSGCAPAASSDASSDDRSDGGSDRFSDGSSDPGSDNSSDRDSDDSADRSAVRSFDVVVVGGGSAGLATTASLLRRRPGLSIAVIEPATEHHYQPGLTLVGAGHFDPSRITRSQASLMPAGVEWIRAAARAIDAVRQRVTLADGRRIGWRALVVANGLELHWDGIEGAREALGTAGVCCNYSPTHAPYTFERVSALRSGTALFTQPAMPIKCAGAPQKAVYLSCDRWRRAGVLDAIDVQFHNSGAVLFGVAHFVPTLQGYMDRYGVDLRFGSTLTAIDAQTRTARFAAVAADGSRSESSIEFDMLHFVPPQRAPALIRDSGLADAGGWLAVDPETLQHRVHPAVFGVGDVVGTGNAKTMAAARRHAPIVAVNLLAQLDGLAPRAGYDGYGACPLTVEAGRVVLAEFGYGGKLLPTFPLEPAVPRRLQWILKRHLMPWIYWDLMLEGREWFAAPAARATAR